MILSNIEITDGSFLYTNTVKHGIVCREWVYDKRTKKPILKISPNDNFTKVNSLEHGNWNVFELRGIVRRLGNGNLSFFSDENLGHNLLVYRIRKSKFGTIHRKNKYCRIDYQKEVGDYIYFFISFGEAKNIDFEVLNKRGKIIDTLKPYRKKKLLSAA